MTKPSPYREIAGGITGADFVNMADALFEGNHDAGQHGWVTMAANQKGRECIEALFPDACIAWRDPGEWLPHDWLGFDLNLLDVVAATTTKLPLEITRGADLDGANPNSGLPARLWSEPARWAQRRLA